jgi:hypothetical protein
LNGRTSAHADVRVHVWISVAVLAFLSWPNTRRWVDLRVIIRAKKINVPVGHRYLATDAWL